MDNDILKLLPQKAFKLISIRESLRVGSVLTRSVIDKKKYEESVLSIRKNLKLDGVAIETQLPHGNSCGFSKSDGETILKIYFSQFYADNLAVHLDLRASSFFTSDSLHWQPSKLHYSFSTDFLAGVRSLYEGFYFDNAEKFEKGLFLLGILRESMNNDQKTEIIKLFHAHFGEGKNHPVRFSLKKLQDSFNTIFSHFIKEDIPLNPEFAVLGAMLVTLYLTLETIPSELSTKDAFVEVSQKYKDLP
jgi:hypothetical protein